MMTAQDWIDRLNLKPHPEGGFYKETYRADTAMNGRSVKTAIYFLLRTGEVSHFHRIDADEMWHFYTGQPLTVHMIHAHGHYTQFTLGADMKSGQVFQAVVRKQVWFGAALNENAAADDFALVGCTVAPGFEFSHFEIAKRSGLLGEFPQHSQIIKRLTLPDADL